MSNFIKLTRKPDNALELQIDGGVRIDFDKVFMYCPISPTDPAQGSLVVLAGASQPFAVKERSTEIDALVLGCSPVAQR